MTKSSPAEGTPDEAGSQRSAEAGRLAGCTGADVCGNPASRANAGAGPARRTESVKSLERQAALGRYMLDVRHTLNNALTSVLGNSELLLLEPGSLSVASRSQIETVRNMAVRMHEILQRFSSIEKEFNAVEEQAENEARTRVRVATTNS